VKVLVPAVVGVLAMAQVEDVSVIPAGSEPEEIEHV
jgi:hypothetical protein